MKIKNVCHLPFFAQEPSASLERTAYPTTANTAGAAGPGGGQAQGHGLLIITIAICIWVGLLSDVYPVVSCVYILKATLLHIQLYV